MDAFKDTLDKVFGPGHVDTDEIALALVKTDIEEEKENEQIIDIDTEKVSKDETPTKTTLFLYCEKPSIVSSQTNELYFIYMYPAFRPSTRWGEKGLLVANDEFLSSRERMDRYYLTLHYGKAPENAFDERADERSIVSEEFVIMDNALDETMWVAEGAMDTVTKENLESWKRILSKNFTGKEIYLWFEILVLEYRMHLEFRKIDLSDYVKKIEKEARSGKRKDDEATSDGLTTDPEVEDAVKRLALRFETRKKSERRAIRRRKLRKQGPVFQDLSEDDYIGKLKILRPDEPIPFGRLAIHHTFISALTYYSVTANVVFTVTEEAEKKHVQPMLPNEWSLRAWDFFTPSSLNVKKYTYIQNPDEVIETENQECMHKPRWRDSEFAQIGNPMPCQFRSGDCIRMTQLDDKVIRISAPIDLKKAKLCVQVIFNVQVSYFDNVVDNETKYIAVSYVDLPQSIEERLRKEKRGKRTPFNCCNPACDGVIDGLARCLHVNLDKDVLKDNANNTEIHLSTSIKRRARIPFVWGDSMIQADTQVVRYHDEDMNEKKDLLISNIYFTSDTEILKIALSELIKYEDAHTTSTQPKEALRTAEQFIRRSK